MVRQWEPDPSQAVLASFQLFSTRTRLYLVARNSARTEWRILKLARGLELDVAEDPVVYSERECSRLLQEIHDGNRNVGGLRLVCTAHGVAGCVRFLEGYYLLLITDRRLVGKICNQPVYGIEEVKLQPLMQADALFSSLSGREKAHEQRYQRLLMQVLENNEFFFSYTYNLHQTLQANLMGPASTSQEGDKNRDPFSSMFIWNHYLTKELHKAVGHSKWVLPLLHGFWQQRSLSIYGRIIRVTLIARRSRHFAGTRYRKRGVNKQGYVANDVETEQVVDASGEWTGAPSKLASIVQVRGSIPLFWSQDEASLTAPKPEINLLHFDPLFNATRLHFKDLAHRYGCPITVLNLVKQAERTPRECVLGAEFGDAIRYLNKHLPEDEHIVHIPFDFQKMARMMGSSHTNVISSISKVVQQAMDITGIFSYLVHGRHGVHGQNAGPDGRADHEDRGSVSCVDDTVCTMEAEASVLMCSDGTDVSSFDDSDQGLQVNYQDGVVRTNCIDCLDRTNVAQFALGLVAIGRQFAALGVTAASSIDVESTMSVELGHMYEAMGNCLAQQYGGSDAHTKFFKDQRGEWSALTHSEDVMTSLRRFYSNINTDPEKQDAMNLFLGRFVPQHGKPPVWELGNDVHLHASRGLLLDDDNFDIFWGEMSGQAVNSPSENRENANGGTGYLPRRMGSFLAVGSAGSPEIQGSSSGTSSYCVDESDQLRQVADDMGSWNQREATPSESSFVVRMAGESRISMVSGETSLAAEQRTGSPYKGAADSGRQGPTLRCLEEIMEEYPNRLTEVRLFVPNGSSPGQSSHSTPIRFFNNSAALSPRQSDAEATLLLPAVSSSSSLLHQIGSISRCTSFHATVQAQGKQRDAPLVSAASRLRRHSFSGSMDSNKAVARLQPLDENQPSPEKHSEVTRSPITNPCRRRTREVGWPEHALQNFAIEIDTQGSSEDIEGQIEGQLALLWDTVVMDWVHDRNNGSPETHFRFHEDSVFQMLGTFPEDDDLAAAIVHPEEANKLFLSPAAGNVPRRLRLPLEQNLLSELFLSA